jgi:hypothetical protein
MILRLCGTYVQINSLYRRRSRKTKNHLDTIIPLKTNMDAYMDVIGLERRKDFHWEPFVLPAGSRHPRAFPTLSESQGMRFWACVFFRGAVQGCDCACV